MECAGGAVLKVVTQWAALAEVPANRLAMSRHRATVDALARFLRHESPEVSRQAARTVVCLCADSRNMRDLSSNARLLDALRACAEAPSGDESFRQAAEEALSILEGAPGLSAQERDQGPGRPESLTLHSSRLSEPAAREEIERRVLALGGVVSVVTYPETARIVVVLKTSSEGLAARVRDIVDSSSSESPASQDTPEAIPPLLFSPKALPGPRYLDDEPVDGGESDEGGNAPRHAITLYGFSSLEARLEARRLEEVERERRQRKINGFFERLTHALTSILCVC